MRAIHPLIQPAQNYVLHIRFFAVLILLIGLSACDNLSQAPAGGISITINNQSEIVICEVYISAEQNDDWGDNFLTEGQGIPAGSQQTFTVSDIPVDIWIRDCSGEALYSQGAVNSNITITIGDLGMQSLHVTNDSDREVCYFYITTDAAKGWGEDNLGKVESILPGQSRYFFLKTGIYSLRAEDCEHNIIDEVSEMNLQQSSSWVISPK